MSGMPMPDDGDDPAEKDIKVLVVGQTADGKSTLLESLLDPVYYALYPDEKPTKLDMGSSEATGTTDEITGYKGMKIPGTSYRLRIYDTPGVGTEQCPIEDIMAMIRAEFEAGTQFQCILVTAPSTTTTPGSGARIVKMLLDEGFCGLEADAWNHVILVGTKADRANAAEKKRFLDAIVPQFFNGAPEGCEHKSCFTAATTTDQDGNALDQHGNVAVDTKELLNAISELPDLESFFFVNHGLTPQLLEKVCRKIMGKGVEDAKQMSARLKEALGREQALLEHAPGDEKQKKERQFMKDLLKKSGLTPGILADLEEREEFFKDRLQKYINGFNTRMTRPQLIEEMEDEKLVIKLRPGEKYPRGKGLRFAAPPHGTKADMTWRLYINKYKEDVQQKYQKWLAAPDSTAVPAAPAASAAAGGSGRRQQRTPAAAGSAQAATSSKGKSSKRKAVDLDADQSRQDRASRSKHVLPSASRSAAPVRAAQTSSHATWPLQNKKCASCKQFHEIHFNSLVCKSCGKKK